MRIFYFVVYFISWIIFQKNTKCFMNSLNNGMHRKDMWFFQNIISPVVIQLKLENVKLIFITLDLSYANDACVFRSKECVNNISVNMLKTNFLTCCMQMSKENPGCLEFFICLPRWLRRTHLLLNVSHVTCKSSLIANQALQEERDCRVAPSHQSKFYFHNLIESYW